MYSAPHNWELSHYPIPCLTTPFLGSLGNDSFSLWKIDLIGNFLQLGIKQTRRAKLDLAK